MIPEGVGKGVPLVYSKLSPGRNTGCSPTTPAPRIGDPPVPVPQLDRPSAIVLDADVIGPDEVRLLGGGFFVKEIGLHRDGDALGCLAIHGAILRQTRDSFQQGSHRQPLGETRLAGKKKAAPGFPPAPPVVSSVE